MNLRRQVCTAFAFTAIASLSSIATAQPPGYPSKPITVVVPFAAGGSADLIARVLAEAASRELGQPLVIDNRSGGDGTIGAQLAARAKADGYTLLQMSTGHVILPILRTEVGYDWQRSFVPVFGTTMVPQAIAVNAKSQIRTAEDLAALARATPKGIDYASGGAGSISHLTGAFFARSLRIPATHVAYRGLSNAVQAVLSDQVMFTVVNIPDVAELVKARSLRLIAVTSAERLPQLPEVPTLVEQGFRGWTSASWSAYLAPAKTPPEMLERIYRAYSNAANDPSVKDRLSKVGVTLQPMNGKELESFMRKESSRWRTVIEENQIKLEE